MDPANKYPQEGKVVSDHRRGVRPSLVAAGCPLIPDVARVQEINFNDDGLQNTPDIQKHTGHELDSKA
eukprot:1159003-Pelagomonas_calceolata.AAC.5